MTASDSTRRPAVPRRPPRGAHLFLLVLLLLAAPASARAASFAPALKLGETFGSGAAVLSDGTVVVANQRVEEIALTRIAPDGTRSPTQILKGDGDHLQIASNGDTTVVAWEEEFPDSIQYSVSQGGGPFGAPRTITKLDDFLGELHAVATPAHVVVAWTEETRGRVRAAVGGPDGALGAPQRITASADDDTFSLAPTADGGALVGWVAKQRTGAVYAVLKPTLARFGIGHRISGAHLATVSDGVVGFTSDREIGAIGPEPGAPPVVVATSKQEFSLIEGPVFARPGGGLPLTAAWTESLGQDSDAVYVSERAAAGGPWSTPRVVARDKARIGLAPAAGATATTTALVFVRARHVDAVVRTGAGPYSAPVTLGTTPGDHVTLAAGPTALAATWADGKGNLHVAILRG